MHVDQNIPFSLFIQQTFTCNTDTDAYTARPKYLWMHFFSIKYEMDLDIMNVLNPPTSSSANEQVLDELYEFCHQQTDAFHQMSG